MCHNPVMNLRPLLALAALGLVIAPAAHAEPPAVSVKLRYHFVPGRTLRYLVQRDPYFDDPAGAVETTDPDASYKPPIVERLTEEVLAVGSDGTATVKVTAGPEPGFEDEAHPQPLVTRTVRVTPLGQVLTPVEDAAMGGLLRAFFRLSFAPVGPGETWQGTAYQGAEGVKTDLALTAVRYGGQGLAVITQTLPPTVTQSRSSGHDGTLLQTTRGDRSDRIVFDAGAGILRRQTSTMTVTLSLVMTGRGARGAADFGHVIPTVRVIQKMTIERQEDALSPPALAFPSPASPSPASTGQQSKS